MSENTSDTRGGNSRPSRYLIRSGATDRSLPNRLRSVDIDVDPTVLVCILGNSRPEQWRRTWEREFSGHETEVVAGLIGNSVSGPASADGAGTRPGGEIDDDRRISAADLPEVGDFLLTALTEWRDERESFEENRAVVFDSASTLLDEHSLETVFKFLFVVGQKLSHDGVSFYVHVDENVHDEHTINVLAGAFDETLTVGA